MLFLIFHLGSDRYAIPARSIREVLPLANFKKIPHAPDGIAGVLNYHERHVPVVDAVKMASGRNAELVLSTRIILVELAEGRELGLIAEEVKSVREFNPSLFRTAQVQSERTPWLGKILDEGDMIQWVHPEEMFSEEVLASLVETKGELTGS